MRRNRAVSTTLSYTLTLAISALLVSGLLIAATGFVDDRRKQVIRDELDVIGSQVISELTRIDRLVVAADSSNPTVNSTQRFPNRVAGSQYRITLNETNEQLVLESVDPSVSVILDVSVQKSLQDSTTEGGPVKIAYRSGGITIYGG